MPYHNIPYHTILGIVNGNPFQYSCVENPMDKEAWGAIIHGVAKSQTWLSDWADMYHTILYCYCSDTTLYFKPNLYFQTNVRMIYIWITDCNSTHYKIPLPLSFFIYCSIPECFILSLYFLSYQAPNHVSFAFRGILFPPVRYHYTCSPNSEW